MANALNRHEKLPPHAFTAAIVRRDAFGRRRAFRAVVAEAGDRVVGYACLEWGVRADNRRAKKFYQSLGARVGNARVASLIGRSMTALAAPR